MGGSYAGAGMYANRNPDFRKIWLESVPGGQPALDRIKTLEEEASQLTVEGVKEKAMTVKGQVEQGISDLRKGAEETYEGASKRVGDAREAVEAQMESAKQMYSTARETVEKTYESTVENIGKAQETVTKAVNDVFATFQNFRDSILGKPTESTPPPVPTPTHPPIPTPSPTPKPDAPPAVEKTPAQPEPATAKKAAKAAPKKEEKKETPAEKSVETTPPAPATPVEVAPPEKASKSAAKTVKPESREVVKPEASKEAVDAGETEVRTEVDKKKEKEAEREARRKRRAERAAAKEKDGGDKANTIADIIKVLPDIPVAEDLVAAIAHLDTALKNIKGTPEEKKYVSRARKELALLSKYITAFGKEEQELTRSALIGQAEKFKAVLDDHIRAAEEAFKQLATDAETTQNALIQEQRDALTALHQLELAQQLETQAAAFREALDQDLRNQAAELERFWMSEVKGAVDRERDGRLARLDHLAAKLKYLERISIDAGDYLHETRNIELQTAALHALRGKLAEKYRLPFAKELEVLRQVGAENPVVASIVESIPVEVGNKGLATFKELESAFEILRGRVRQVQLMPEDGGPLAYAVSSVLSVFMVPKSGYVAGDDVESILARSRHFLREGDLDSAARELNQLKGWPKRLAADWLESAREHLVVAQALEVC
ncbi:Formation of crista junctions protein 1 [Irineochytrium annulatum]|nr:Formation of crista junctions protein 1 [Irineochytrium annulatum]